MNNTNPQKAHTKFRQGLAATLFGWFMLLSLTPIGIIGFIEYRAGKQAIIESRYQELSSINLLISEQIKDYFESVVSHLHIKSNLAMGLMIDLKKGFRQSGQPLKSFVKSDQYDQTLQSHSNELISFLEHYDYSDVLLADTQGNILYTINGDSDLGRNLFEDPVFRDTKFARTAQRSLKKSKPLYSDVDQYPTMKGQPVSFFIIPLMNNHGEAEGFLAVQIMTDNVQSIFDNDSQYGVGLASYLVGLDGYIRYGTGLTSVQTMTRKVNNPLVRDWQHHIDPETGEYNELVSHQESHSDDHIDGAHDHDEGILEENIDFGLSVYEGQTGSDVMNSQVMAHIASYRNADGHAVLGTFHPISVAGTPMVLISEVKQSDAFMSVKQFRDRLLFITGITILLVLLTAAVITRRLVNPIKSITAWVNRVASGDYVQVKVNSVHNEISELSNSFSGLTEQLRQVISDNERKSWLQDGQAGLNDSFRGEQEIAELCKNIVSYLTKYLGMQTGAMYVLDDQNQLHLKGTYAWTKRKQTSNSFELGEGMVGQAALEKEIIELTDLPEDYMMVESGLGKTVPRSVIVVPLVYENEVNGVFEFGMVKELSEDKKQFLKESVEKVAIAINSAQYRTRVNQLLEKTTKQSEAMREQQQELEAVNDELESRAQVLEESKEELKAQSEEMQRSNTELEEKTEMLLQQKAEIERKNLDIEMSKKTLEEKAKELELASKYKSEFLANMSHELRTPLNSLLLLAQMLAENDEGNLTEEQIESAEVIYNGGKELLDLINDILDLSKVEAGKMSVNLEYVDLEELCSNARSLFKPLAESRGLEFSVDVDDGVPNTLLSDSQRLMQILKNFLSNAFKFTEKGGVYIRVKSETRPTAHGEVTYAAFEVRDTGIGIPKEKQAAIFEAFQQADGSTSRKYGGTGLGLAISKEFAGLLGGFIGLESEDGKGTAFTLYLPDNAVCSLSDEPVKADSFSNAAQDKKLEQSVSPVKQSAPSILNDEDKTVNPVQKASSEASDKSLLVIEDDQHFSGIVSQIASSHEYTCLIANTGKQGLELAKSKQPKAIVLDLGLPDMDGKEVLDTLKNDAETKDIPVHIISGKDKEEHNDARAISYLTKPVTVADLDKTIASIEHTLSKDIGQTLLLDPDEESRAQLKRLLENKGLTVGESVTGEDGIASQLDNKWQCIVMDVDLPDMTGLEFLDRLIEETEGNMPTIVIHTGRQLDKSEYDALQKYSSSMVLKGELASERITDEVTLFIHSIKKAKVAQKKPVNLAENALEGHKILLVDDDLRNTFALSKRLQTTGLEVIIADNGQIALDKLEEEEGIELVLMDIMMPVMDGYEAMTKMRKIPHLKAMPVIALTAKAMSDDKAKCIEAGANDYMTKPVDLEKLVAMIKLWLSK